MVLARLHLLSKCFYVSVLSCLACLNYANRLHLGQKQKRKNAKNEFESGATTDGFSQASDMNLTQASGRPAFNPLTMLLVPQTSATWQVPMIGSSAALGPCALPTPQALSDQPGVIAHGLRTDRLPVALMQGRTSSINFPSPFEIAQRLSSEEGRRLQQELLELAVKQDAQTVIRRTLDLVNALQTVGLETASDFSSNQGITFPRLLRRMCEQLGATYVKLGQFIASTPQLFPAEYVQEFQTVLDQTAPMPWSDVCPLIEEQLGKPLGQVYSSVEEIPLAAASIAQVHAATLRTGEDVVIKVQRKGVEGSLRADLDLLYANARMLELLGVGNSALSEVVGTLREAIFEEIDFRLEANRTTQFSEFLDRTPGLKDLVAVPKVYPAASSERILTLERLYGSPLVDLDSVRKYTESPEKTVISVLKTWISSLLTNEWFHADLHAGNLLILTDGRVAFIDFGIVGSISRSAAESMLLWIWCFNLPDDDDAKAVGITAAMNGLGFTGVTKKFDSEDAKAMARDVGEVLESLEKKPGESLGVAGDAELNRAVAAIGQVAAKYGVRFPRELSLVVKQTLYLDRYTSLLTPDLDLMTALRETTWTDEYQAQGRAVLAAVLGH